MRSPRLAPTGGPPREPSTVVDVDAVEPAPGVTDARHCVPERVEPAGHTQVGDELQELPLSVMPAGHVQVGMAVHELLVAMSSRPAGQLARNKRGPALGSVHVP